VESQASCRCATPASITLPTSIMGVQNFLTAFCFATSALSASARLQRSNIALRSTEPVSLPYRNASLSVDERVEDLLQRMTLEEKAGQMFQIPLAPGGPDGSLSNDTAKLVQTHFMSHFNLRSSVDDAQITAEWYNRIQEMAANTRLGIPITMSTDPRHAFTDSAGSGFAANAFSQWPATTGLAALRDAELVHEFANIARQEYRAIGIRVSLHPQVDLSTEPRWARIGATMGEDANLTAELVVAYIKGFTTEEFGHESVSTVTKHFPGSGPVQRGEDSHFQPGENATYPGNMFEHHLIPFKAAIAAGARQIMPYYSRPIGTKYEEVAAGMNKGIVTDLLRGELGFDGIVVTDWGLVTDGVILGQFVPARAWGAQNLTEIERAAKIIDAGADQFGGEERFDLISQLVGNGTISTSRIDTSIRRLLREKFLLGLFDNPYVNATAAKEIVGREDFVALGALTQRRSYTLLSNKDDVLPLKPCAETKYYVEGINATILAARNMTIVTSPAEADMALLRIGAPYEPRPGGFEKSYHSGSLEFNATEKARQAAIYSAVPTIVDIYLERPAAIPEIAEQAAALLGNYGASPDAFLDVVFGVDGVRPEGRLPFELPRSMAAVEASREDVPYDSVNPVFKYGHGLEYAS
jgi:beta-glucosidase